MATHPGPWATVFVALFIAASAIGTLLGRRRLKRALEAGFAHLDFDTPHGRVKGSSLRVVKVSRQTMPLAYDEVFAIQHDAVGSDAFWYCVGPGPCWFLVIPVVAAGMGDVDIRWVVRPLTEARMRGALVGDARALARAGLCA